MKLIGEEDPIIEFLKNENLGFDQLPNDSAFLVDDTKQVAEPTVGVVQHCRKDLFLS